MAKFNPANPAHVRARAAIQGWLWKLHETGLEVIDAEELEKLKSRVIYLEAVNEVSDKLYRAQNEVLDLIPECEEHGEGCLLYKADWIKGHLATSKQVTKPKPQRGTGRQKKNNV